MQSLGKAKRLTTAEIKLAWFAERNPLARRVLANKAYFYRTCESLQDEDSSYRPAAGMLTVSGQVLHVTIGITLLLYSVFDHDEVSGRGVFEVDGSEAAAELLQRGLLAPGWMKFANNTLHGFTVTESLAVFDRNMELLRFFFSKLSEAELAHDFPPNFLFTDGFTRLDALEGILDHNAHHRGGLAQYARMLNRDPKIPYVDISERLTEEHLLS